MNKVTNNSMSKNVETSGEKTDHRAVLGKALLEIKRLQARVKSIEAQQRAEPIAVIGMACRFPGGVSTPDALWQYLRAGRNAVQEIPAARWDVDAHFDAVPGKQGKMYTRHGYFIDEIAQFDRAFFNIGPAEADAMDPQHRLLLETTWESLEHAGLAPLELRGSHTGVFIGAMNSDYAHFSVQSQEAISMYTAITNGNGIAAGRIAHNFGFQGPALAIDTLCSSSLVSVHMAMRSLQNRECELAVAGGVNLLVTPSMFVATCAANMLAVDGLCKTFDEAADGYARGEGCGMIALKRLSDAQRDGDPILAVIRGGAVNQDGPSSALPVPNGKAQEKVIRAALHDAGLEAAQVGYVEAHGTGTALGDPLEIEALNHVFGATRAAQGALMLGSIKTNYGHTEGAAGIAGLLKVILALQHGEIPPHLNFSTPSSRIDWSTLPIEVVSALRAWPAGAVPRIAGVSAFGIGGTNAHLLVEEAPARAPDAAHRDDDAMVLTLSARSAQALRTMTDQYLAHLARPEIALAPACYTSNVSRASLPLRLSVCAASRAQMLAQLRGHQGGAAPARVGFVFSGEGSHYPDMGRALYRTQPLFAGHIDRCAALLADQLDVPLSALLWGADSARLAQVEYAQPALFALQYALAETWAALGVKPMLVMGHGVGEYAAACHAGLFSLRDALSLVVARARLTAQLCQPGAMSVLACAPAEAKDLLRESGLEAALSVAALNGPRSVTVAGQPAAMAQLLALARAQGIEWRELLVSHAAHGAMVEPMQDAFRAVAEKVVFQTPRLRIVSSVTGQLGAIELANAAYWVRHARSAVKFEQGLRALAANKIDCALEIGPGADLASMSKDCFADGAFEWLASLAPQPAAHAHLASAARLWERGVDLNWKLLHQSQPCNRAVLPGYPFQRQRHWLDDAVTRPARSQAPAPAAQPAAGDASLRERVIAIVSAVAGKTASGIEGEHRFYEELGYDSMMIMELKSRLELALESKQKIAVKDMMRVTTVDQLVQFAHERMLG